MDKTDNSLSFQEVQNYLDETITPIQRIQKVSVAAARGRVLAQDILSPVDLPAFDNSAMDGWALNSQDIAAEGFTLKQCGSSFAGHPYDKPLRQGQCVRIMTGGQIPAGADTVVMQEVVSVTGKDIGFPAGVKKGANVRLKGEDLRQGQVALSKGAVLHAPQIGFLVSLGVQEVAVYDRIKVAFYSTGDELQSLGAPLKEGHIYDSNRYTIGAMLQEAGFEPINLGIVPDNEEQLSAVLRNAAQVADAVITSGGVSVGQADFTRKVLLKEGALVDWHCRIKPGRPLAFGQVGEALFFGLPGNPTAAQVTFYTIVRGALQRLSGQTEVKPVASSAILMSPLRKKTGYTEFKRGVLKFDGAQATVQSAGSQKTGATAAMMRANCFIWLDENQASAEPGDRVTVVPFSGICF